MTKNLLFSFPNNREKQFITTSISYYGLCTDVVNIWKLLCELCFWITVLKPAIEFVQINYFSQLSFPPSPALSPFSLGHSFFVSWHFALFASLICIKFYSKKYYIWSVIGKISIKSPRSCILQTIWVTIYNNIIFF